MKRACLLFVCLLLAPSAYAQQATVTAIMGSGYANGTINLVKSGTGSGASRAESFDASGNLSIQLPQGTQWTATVCPTTATCYNALVQVTASFLDISLLLVSASSGGGGAAGFAFSSLPFSSTPTFDATKTINTLTLTGNVTSSTATGGLSGKPLWLKLCNTSSPNTTANAEQTIVWPTNFSQSPSFLFDTVSGCADYGFGWDGSAFNLLGEPHVGRWGEQYVMAPPLGNDANDGYSWATPKATIYAALEALPFGKTTNPPTAGSGTVHVGEFSQANPTATAGVWICNTTDPNCTGTNVPGPGWLQLSTSGAIDIVGESKRSNQSNSHIPQTVVSQPSATVAIWLSGTGKAIRFQNLNFSPAPVGLRAGINSNLNRSNGTGGAADWTLDNVSLSVPQTAGAGPVLDIGFNSFFWVVKNSVLTANASEAWPVGASGLVRTAGVVVATTTTNHNIAAAQRFHISGTADPTWNGTFTATSVTSNTITYSQAGPNATSGGGAISSDFHQIALLDAGGGGSGPGYGTFQGDQFNGGAGVMLIGPANALMFNDTIEGSSPNPTTPILWQTGPATCCPHSMAIASDIADQVGTVGDVEVDAANGWAGNNVNMVVIGGFNGVVGPATATIGTGSFSGSVSAQRQKQNGPEAFNFRRTFGQSSVNVLNRALELPAYWITTGTGCTGPAVVTTGVASPDGTSQGGRVSFAGGGNAAACYYQAAAETIAAGDWIMAGGWASSHTANGWASSGPFQVSMQGAGDLFDNGAGSFITFGGTTDGEWQWYVDYHRITQATTSPTTLQLATLVDSAHSVDVRGPVILHFPSTVTQNEIAEIASNLQAYSNNCAVGDYCGLARQRFVLGAPNTDFLSSFTSAGWTASRSYIWPDKGGTVAMITDTPSSPLYDNFNRADGAVGANWTNQQSGLNVSSNQVVGINSFTNQYSFYSATSVPSSNQYAQAYVTTVGANFTGNSEFVGVMTNASGTGGSTANYICSETGNLLAISKTVANVTSTLTSGATTGAVQDLLRLEHIGTVLSCYKNGSTVAALSTTDSAVTGGQPGLYVNSNTTKMDNFSGGPLSAFAGLATEQEFASTQHFLSISLGVNGFQGTITPTLTANRAFSTPDVAGLFPTITSEVGTTYTFPAGSTVQSGDAGNPGIVYGANAVGITGSGSPADKVCISGFTPGNPALVPIAACGTDANITLTLAGKGTGVVSLLSLLQTQPLTVAALPTAAAGNAGQVAYVTDSTTVATEGQTCVGLSTNKALAFSNGVVWKCF